MVPNLGVGRVDFDLGRVGAVWLQFYIFFFLLLLLFYSVWAMMLTFLVLRAN